MRCKLKHLETNYRAQGRGGERMHGLPKLNCDAPLVGRSGRARTCSGLIYSTTSRKLGLCIICSLFRPAIFCRVIFKSDRAASCHYLHPIAAVLPSFILCSLFTTRFPRPFLGVATPSLRSGFSYHHIVRHCSASQQLIDCAIRGNKLSTL